MEIDDWREIFDPIENKLTKGGIWQVVMAKLLNIVGTNNYDILEQIKIRLKKNKDVYEKWEQESFDVNHIFNVSSTINNDERFDEECTLLHIAVQVGYLEIVKYLVENGAKVDEKEADGYTPLHLAALNGHLDVVTTLLENGAKVDEKEADGYTPLHIAARYGHTEIVKALIGKGAKVDAANKNEWTPLHIAAGNGHLDVVTTLLENGAKVDAANKNEWTPLHIAAGNGHLDVVTTLLENGAKVDEKEADGYTPLHIAARTGHTEIVKALIGEGAKVDAADENEWTPLHIAAQNGHLDVVTTLLENGAKVDEKEANGWTPLHLAAFCYHEGIVKLLEAHEAMLKVSGVEKSKCDPKNSKKEDVNQASSSAGSTPAVEESDSPRDGVTKNDNVAASVSGNDNHSNLSEVKLDESRACSDQVSNQSTGHTTQMDDGKASLSPVQPIAPESLDKNSGKKDTQPKLIPTGVPLVASKDSNRVNNAQGNSKQPSYPGKNNPTPQNARSKLPAIAASMLAITGVATGIAIAVYLEMLAVGIAVGACCLVAAAIIYCCSGPSNSLEKSSAEAATNKRCLEAPN